MSKNWQETERTGTCYGAKVAHVTGNPGEPSETERTGTWYEEPRETMGNRQSKAKQPREPEGVAEARESPGETESSEGVGGA